MRDYKQMVDVLWFIPGHGDGPYLGTDYGRRTTSLDYLKLIAQTIDSVGYDGALIPTGFGCEDSWMIAASMIPLTERMKFLIAFRPGSLSPTLAARMAATMDRLSGGRLLLNIITGGDPVELKGDGTFLSHDERYSVSDEFLTIFRAVMQGETISLDGKYEHVEGARINFAPVQKPYPPLFFGGSSDAGLAVAARHIDVYLTLAEPPAMIAEKVAKMQVLAAAQGRTMRFGLRVHVVVRETLDEAWKAAHDILKYVDENVIAEAQAKLARFDSVGQGRMQALHNGHNGSLEVSPNLWAGIGLINKGIGTALVGTPDIVVERLEAYMDLGIDTFILSGYPHLEEALNVGRLVLPRLKGRDVIRDRVFYQPGDTREWQ
jgi:alkanesulfonate monooxygenase